jgi:sucrose-6-phosphate hydrolase SacC (GH32 family)
MPSVSQPTVVYRPDTKTYVMLFVGRVPPSEEDWGGIFWAESKDGLSWKHSSVPVMPRSRLDASFGTAQDSPSLLYWQGRYHVWYAREERVGNQTQRAIAHAISNDGYNWKHSPGAAGGTFVFEPGKAPGWDSRSVGTPSVLVKKGGGLLMWYTGTRYEIGDQPAIGVAGSDDGTKWQRIQIEPVLRPDPGGGELAYDGPSVVYDATNEIYRMWYTHRAFGQSPTIHYAVSADGVGWTKWSEPALSTGRLGTFDERGVTDPAALLMGRVKLWYTGVTLKGVEHLGYAENRGAL